MEVNLVKEDIKIEQNIENVSTQILLEGDVIVPDVNPDILEILESDANVVIDKISVSENRINYIGKLEIQILYLAKGGNVNIQSMSCIIPIDDFINVDGVNEQMWAEVIPTIQNIDYNILNDRKISTRSIININAYGQKEEEITFIKDAEDLLPSQVKKSTLNVNKMVEKITDRFIVKEQLMVSQSSNNITKILRKDAKIINKDFKCTNGKVYVSADLNVSILYKDDTEDSLLEIIEKEITFNGYIELPKSKEDMHPYVDLNISEFNAQIKADEDGEDRVIDVEISIFANCKVSKEEEISVLDDGYIIGKELVLEKKEIQYPKLICRNKTQSTIKEIINITGEEVMQVFKVSANSIIEDVSINEDRLICEGIVNVSVLYIAQNDESPLCSYKAVLPFRQVIEVRGAKDYMSKKVTSCLEHVSFNMISDREVEVRILISFNSEVIETKTKTIVTDVSIFETDKEILENMPSMVIYVVQKDDKLWDIAKKYNTDIDDIIEVNNIENPELIFEGQKLLVLKKVRV